MRIGRTAIISLTLGLAAAAGLAGPLNPPAQVASTFKTLAEVEPRVAINAANTPGDADSVFRIAAAGSYYLAADVIGAASKNGIEIAAVGDVTIDLRGFRLIGGAGSLRGILVSSGVSNGRIAIRNGSVSNWLSGGIILDGSDRPAQIEHVTAHDNGGAGITAGPGAVVARCVAKGNAGTGILVEASSSVTECVADGNDAGFVLGSSSHAVGCSAASNSLDGFASAGSGLSFTGCTARSNGGSGFDTQSGTFTSCAAIGNAAVGIDAGAGSALSNCQSVNNDGAGIVSGEASALSHCLSRSNGVGFLLGHASAVAHCTATSNSGHGFQANAVGLTYTACTARLNTGSGFFGTRSTYTGCAARENALVGFEAGGGSTITGCIAQANNTDGIRVTDDSYILNNICEGNGTGSGADAAGIHATAGNNRIEGNNCVGNDRGIQVDGSANFIVRNSVAGPLPYVSVGTQSIGPIITNLGTITSTNPWANFVF